MSVVEVSANYGGRLLTLQTGKIAKQADASVWAKYGDTIVLVNVCSSRKLGKDPSFFPLTVDFQEKYYAAGRIPGGFFKREAKPSDKATLSARLIDRPVRPLFPEDYLYDTFITVTVLSSDGVNEPDILASIAASTALHISDIPFAGPVGTCRVGLVNGEFVCNIAPADAENSTVDLLVSGLRSGVVMVEGSAKEVSEKQMMDAIEFAHEQMLPILDLQDELRRKVGKEKRQYEKPERNDSLKAEMKKAIWGGFEKAFAVREKLARYEALHNLEDTAKEKFQVAEPATKEDETRNKLVGTYFEELKAQFARELTLHTKKRIDGRAYNEIRNISCEVGLLPRVHGSALFTRGETQVLAAVTLGTSDDEQKIDNMSGTYQKTFMLHYNFPPYSVGEARPLRPPGRREIGHGHLAERALAGLIPPNEAFPYTIRLVSEVLESNGSSSMATVCSGSMAMMDAGVPLPKPVAGVAMGLIKEGPAVAVLSDILGDEDHLGDMDFKVCGTADGITAFQMDLKIGGVDRIIMEQALEQAREGRLHVLGKMNEVLSTPRTAFSPYAPRIFTIKVKPDKVREVIGSGGKVIRSIIERTGVKIDIEDDGSIHIASADETAAQKAIDIINQIVEEPEPGKIYEGTVSRIADFGAFVEIIPGTDGLCHISELENYRVKRVEDVVKVGDVIRVKCLEVDPSGKIRLSRKAAMAEEGSSGSPKDEGGTEDSEEEHEPVTPSPAVEAAPEDDEEFGLVESVRDDEERELRDEISGNVDRGHRDEGRRDRGRGHRGGGRGENREGRTERSGPDRGRSSGFDRDRGGRGGGRSAGGGGGRGNDRNDRGGNRGDRGGTSRGGRSTGGGGERSYGRDAGGRGGDRGERPGNYRDDRGGHGRNEPRYGFDPNRRDRGEERYSRGGGEDRGNRGDDYGNRAPSRGEGGYGGGGGGYRGERPSRGGEDRDRGPRRDRDEGRSLRRHDSDDDY